MNQKREKMLDEIIRIYGFEHKITIAIAKMLEEWEENDWNDHALEILVKCHKEDPYKEDEE